MTANWRDYLEPGPQYFLAGSYSAATAAASQAGDGTPGAGAPGAADDYTLAEAVIFGVPMDFTTSFRPGTRLGPTRIREVSDGLEDYSMWQQATLYDRRYADLGDIAVVYGDVNATLARIEAVAAGIHADGKKPFVLGGEHLITLPLVAAAAARHPGLVVVQFDAHADLRDDYLGNRLSHATVMRRCAEIVGAENIWQFGIRSGTADEHAFARANTRLHPFAVLAPLREALPALAGRPVYVTVDIDVCDPGFAPGTGTPEPGGISSRELMEALHLLRGVNVVGFDVVEVSPELDPSGATSVLGAMVMREALLACLT